MAGQTQVQSRLLRQGRHYAGLFGLCFFGPPFFPFSRAALRFASLFDFPPSFPMRDAARDRSLIPFSPFSEPNGDTGLCQNRLNDSVPFADPVGTGCRECRRERFGFGRFPRFAAIIGEVPFVP